jgi:hypothetical protein
MAMVIFPGPNGAHWTKSRHSGQHDSLVNSSSRTFIMVWEHDQNNEPKDAQQAKAAKPLGVSLGLRIIHATPNERCHTCETYSYPQEQEQTAPAGQEAACEFQQDTRSDTDVGVSLILRQHI